MIFTQEQINEIEHRLAKKGTKDTQLPSAKTPLTGDESMAVVQEGENRLIPVGSILNTDGGIFNVSEYLKVKTEADTSVVLTLSEAIEACPSRVKKAGQIIAFLDKTNIWQQYQYQSNNITDWNNLLKWKNLNDINTKPIDDETAVIYNISDYIPGGSKYGQVIFPGVYTIYGTTTPVSQYRVIGGYDDSLGEVSFPSQLDETIVIKEIDDSLAIYDTYYLFAGNSINGYGYQTTLYSGEDTIPDYILRAFGDDSAYVLVNIKQLENRINNKLEDKVDKVQGKDLSTNDFTNENVSELANSVVDASYNSNTKKLVFTKNNSETVEVDATPFIKDGMVNNVSIVDGYLVITFNTDSGKETIRIALTDIFNPNDYYTKTQTDNFLGNKVDKEQGKGLSSNDYTTEEKTKLNDLPTALELTEELADKANTNDLSKVATSGSYNDLSDKPTIPSITGKADKVSNATNGNFAALDSNGNLTDSGHKHSDYLTEHQDITGKENIMSVISTTGTTLSAQVGNYYRITNVNSLTITLPTVTVLSIRSIVFLITTTSSMAGQVQFTSTGTKIYQNGFTINAGTTNEVTALWNGYEWTITNVVYS